MERTDDLKPYTVEELHERVRRAEAYFNAGNKGIPNEEVMAEMEEFVNRLEPYTIEELHERIREAEADIAAGRVYTHDEHRQLLRERFPWLK